MHAHHAEIIHGFDLDHIADLARIREHIQILDVGGIEEICHGQREDGYFFFSATRS